MRVELWTDGSSNGRADDMKPGGWAFVLRAVHTRDPETGRAVFVTPGGGLEAHRLERSGYVLESTNNRMELQALIEGLNALKRRTRVHVYTDSEYVMKPFTEGWLAKWRRKRWHKVKNADLWQILDELARGHYLEFHHVKGHSGVDLNERCDELAGEARKLGLRMVPEDPVDNQLTLA